MELGIVIATYNRAHLLRGCLDSLIRQTEPAANYEIIVVVDGSTDDSAQVLASYARLENLRVHVQSNQGVGAARNKGAEISSARLLLFLDDDMVAAPDLVSTHVQAHRDAAEIVGLGHIVDIVPAGADYFTRSMAQSLSDHYDRLANARDPAFMDCYSGNLSVTRDAFMRVGGFAVDLPRSEDVEFGYRLHVEGLRFVYLQTAIAHQEYRKTFDEIAADTENAGAAALELYARHPAMLPYMHLAEFRAAGAKLQIFRAVLLALSPPNRLLLWLSSLVERGRTRRSWHRLLYSYYYWRGVRMDPRGRQLWQQLTDGTRILMYHAVGLPGERASRFVIPQRRFDRQMRWMKRRGYRVLSFQEYLRMRRNNELPPRKSVILTFDDGYADFQQAGHPVLKQLDLPSTMFVVSGAVGTCNHWDGEGALRERPTLSWESMKQLQHEAVEYGPHSRSHVALTALPSDRRSEEIAGSLSDLKQELGEVLPVFCYPYGKWNDAVEADVADAGYTAACTISSGLNTAKTPLLRLRRTEVYGTDGLIRLGFLLWSGHRPQWPARMRVF